MSDIKKLANQIQLQMARTIDVPLEIKDQFIGHRHVGYVHSDLPIEETPQPYTYEVKHDPIEDPGGWDKIAADLSEHQERITNKKTTGDLSEFPYPPRPIPPITDQIDGEVREIDVNLFGGLSKYFNAESLHHALIFGSIVFGLKMIEMNWTFILGYINSIPIEAVYLSVMFFILTQTIIRAPKTNHTGFK